MRSHSGVATLMFDCSRRENINIKMISTSEIKISVIIDEKLYDWRCAFCTSFPVGQGNERRHHGCKEG